MRKLFTLILVAVMLQSCSSFDTIPLKSKYENPNTFYFDKSFNEVWDATIKVAMRKGFSIKFLDKSSGVISGEKVDMYEVSTIEDKKGLLKDKNAFIVTENIFTGYDNLKPDIITGTWNILIHNENNKTALNINLFPDAKLTIGATTLKSVTYMRAVSTGNFEKLIADSIVF